MSQQEYFIPLRTVKRVEQIRRGIELTVDQERVRVEFIRPGVVRIQISRGGVFDTAPTFAVVCEEFGALAFAWENREHEVEISGAGLIVTIQREPFAWRICRADGTELEAVSGYRFLNGSWMLEKSSSPGDCYYGFGERTGGLNQNGRYLLMWNNDIYGGNAATDPALRIPGVEAESRPKPYTVDYDPYYVSVPLYYRLRGALAQGAFLDNTFRIHYDLRAADRMVMHAEGGDYREYIFAGPAIREVLREYHALTGLPPALPLWALGHHQCRWHAYNHESLVALGEEYRKRGIPCDVLWMDIHYMDGYRVFTWNAELFPDPAKTLASLRENGFRAITIIDPGVKYEPGYPVFDEGSERKLFCRTEEGQIYTGVVWPGLTAFPDFVDEEARRWWGRLNAEHVKFGLSGIWNDMNEPETGAISPYRMRFNRGEYPHERYHNTYATLMAMGTYEGLRTAMPGLRTFILSRAGSPGIQRYAANWTGDNLSTFDSLQLSVPVNCNMALSGLGFVGGDVGGFGLNTTAELLVRWYEYGIFQPFLRNHNAIGNIDQYPWSFGAEAECCIRQAIELRYRLLPYLYTAQMRYAQECVPVQRPLVFDWQQDERCRENDTEFLFGPDFLVAPVCAEGVRSRTLYVPAGEWVDFYTLASVRGGRMVTLDAPLEHIPLLVRAGAVVPMAPVRQSTMLAESESLTLAVFVPADDGERTSYLYEDDGLSDACLQGNYREFEFHCVRVGERLTLTAKAAGSTYNGARRRRFVVRLLGAKVALECEVEAANTDFTVAADLQQGRWL